MRKLLTHKNTQRMIRIRSERPASLVPLLVVESECFVLIRPCLQAQCIAASARRQSFEFNQQITRDAFATVLWANVHSFQLTYGVCDDDCTATDSRAIAISRHHKDDVRFLQRRQIQGVPRLWGIERVLVCIQVGNESNDVRLIGGFLRYVHAIVLELNVELTNAARPYRVALGDRGSEVERHVR
jgi:hypothetical protein